MSQQNEQDLVWVKNPTDFDFEVVWGGYPYKVKAGQKTIYPRFIANHFAKHLTNRILLLKEQEHKKKTGNDKSFVNSKTKRPEVVKTIVTGVYKYFKEDGSDPNAQVAQMISEVNKEAKEDTDKPEDYGEVPDSVLGKLEDEEPDEDHTPEEAVKIEEDSNHNTPASEKNRNELFKEARQLGLNPPVTAKKDDLIEMIKNF